MKLENLIDWREWVTTDTGKRIFPSRFACGWFMRQHERRLVKEGAMVKHRNIWHFCEPEFSQTVFNILREQTLAEMEAA